MEGYKKIKSKNYQNIILRVIPGHFVTAHSHINYYIDLSMMKSRQNEANAVAAALADRYLASTIIDTIVCMDGCEVIGAYLANHLTTAGVISMNAHKTIYITTPEFNTNGQLIFRENIQPMVRDKNILLLLASATTGKTVSQAIESIQYYGGTVTGVSAIFSAASKVYQYPINALFTTADLPDYQTYSQSNCTLCKSGHPVDAIANGFGYSQL